MPFFRSIALKLAGQTPAWAKGFIYRRPLLLRPLAALLKRIVPPDREAVVEITGGPNRGLRLAVDRSVPNYFWLNPDYEPAVQKSFAALLHPGMVAADIGAHMGFDTLHLAILVGTSGVVHAFEPDPANGRRLRRNCELNSLHQVICHATAVSDRKGIVSFSASGTTTSHIAEETEAGSITVPTITLDEAMSHFANRPLNLVKLDVEGSEFKVLQGATHILREIRPSWLIEIHSAQTLTDCVRLLLAARYHVEPLTETEYYANAIARLYQGEEPAFAGFDVGHIRAVPA
jgi:FkbM family methyltransferase